MGKTHKKTQQEYLSEVVVTHNSYYSYEKLVYVRSIDKVVVTCPRHGDFLIGAGKHASGQGCRQCGVDRVTDSQRGSVQDLKDRAYKHFADEYDYSKTEVINDITKVTIICPQHGSFEVTPRKHKQGQGCPTCTKLKPRVYKRTSLEEYVTVWNLKYNLKYDYSRVELKEGNTAVKIICPIHGEFWKTPHRHSSGQGCGKCGVCGFNLGKPASFYILISDEGITKVGITNRHVSLRVAGINRSSGLRFVVHTSIYSKDGEKISGLEQEVLAHLRREYEGIQDKFDGYTECFLGVDIAALLDFILPRAQTIGDIYEHRCYKPVDQGRVTRY